MQRQLNQLAARSNDPRIVVPAVGVLVGQTWADRSSDGGNAPKDKASCRDASGVKTRYLARALTDDSQGITDRRT